jgi:hypothetical protein
LRSIGTSSRSRAQAAEKVYMEQCQIQEVLEAEGIGGLQDLPVEVRAMVCLSVSGLPRISASILSTLKDGC